MAMTTGDDPITSDDFRCSVWTAAQGFDPIGSAAEFDRLVTVEVPQPWPAAVEDMEWVAPIDRPSGTRIQAIVADVGRADGTVLLTRWERDRAVLAGIDWLVPAEDVPAALQLLEFELDGGAVALRTDGGGADIIYVCGGESGICPPPESGGGAMPHPPHTYHAFHGILSGEARST